MNQKIRESQPTPPVVSQLTQSIDLEEKEDEKIADEFEWQNVPSKKDRKKSSPSARQRNICAFNEWTKRNVQPVTDTNTFDFHGLTEPEAKECLNHVIQKNCSRLQNEDRQPRSRSQSPSRDQPRSLSKKFKPSLVTGKGIHSKDYLNPKIKTAFVNHFERRDIPFRFPTNKDGIVNDGVVIPTIDCDDWEPIQ